MRRFVKEASLRGLVVTALIVCAGPLVLPASALALPYREIVKPPSGLSKGIIILIHGGGWAGGQMYVTGARPMAQQLVASGFTVWNVDYTGGAASLADVKAWYELAYDEAKGKPVCTAGQSSGGHLALMIAGAYPTVSCVIAEAAPTDLETLTPEGVQNSAQIWGAGNLKANSPVHNLPSPATEVLLATSDFDQVVPSSQATAYKAARPQNTSVMTMPYGVESYFVHTYTTFAASAQLNAAELAMLARAADVLSVGVPIRDSRKGVVKIPVQSAVAGSLRLSGRGVVSRKKTVAADQPVKLKARPEARVAKALRKKGKAATRVEITLAGAGKPASQSLDIKFRQR